MSFWFFGCCVPATQDKRMGRPQTCKRRRSSTRTRRVGARDRGGRGIKADAACSMREPDQGSFHIGSDEARSDNRRAVEYGARKIGVLQGGAGEVRAVEARACKPRALEVEFAKLKKTQIARARSTCSPGAALNSNSTTSGVDMSAPRAVPAAASTIVRRIALRFRISLAGFQQSIDTSPRYARRCASSYGLLTEKQGRRLG